MNKPLLAIEDPPDFGTDRTNRYRVIDAARNRTVGSIRLHLRHAHHTFCWRWIISVPREGAEQQPSPSGDAETRDEAMQQMRAAWDSYPAASNDPPVGSWCWPAYRLEHMRGRVAAPGQGAWRPGEEPRGWMAAGA